MKIEVTDKYMRKELRRIVNDRQKELNKAQEMKQEAEKIQQVSSRLYFQRLVDLIKDVDKEFEVDTRQPAEVGVDLENYSIMIKPSPAPLQSDSLGSSASGPAASASEPPSPPLEPSSHQLEPPFEQAH